MFIPAVTSDGDWSGEGSGEGSGEDSRGITTHYLTNVLILFHDGHVFQNEGNMTTTFSTKMKNIMSTTSHKISVCLTAGVTCKIYFKKTQRKG